MAQFLVKHNVHKPQYHADGYFDTLEERNESVEATTISAQEHWLTFADGDKVIAMFLSTTIVSVRRIEPATAQD